MAAAGHGPQSRRAGTAPNLNNNNNNNNHSVRRVRLPAQAEARPQALLRAARARRGRRRGGREARRRSRRGSSTTSEKKWRSKAGAPKRVIALDCCLNINKRADAKHKYLIALYTKDEYFAVAAENEQEQEGWYRALTDLVSEGRAGAGDAPPPPPPPPGPAAPLPGALGGSAGAAAADDSYGLVAPATAAYREVWQVNLKPGPWARART